MAASTDINLDEVFAVVSTNNVSIATNENVCSNSYYASNTQVHSINRTDSVASETSHVSTASKTASHLSHDGYANHNGAAPEAKGRAISSHSGSLAPSGDSLLDEIFSTVQLPTVEFTNKRNEEEEVISQLDLAIGDAEQISEEPSSQAPSIASSRRSSARHDLEVQTALMQLEPEHHVDSHHYDPYSDDGHLSDGTLKEDDDGSEGYDHFEAPHLPYTVKKEPNFRARTQTMDSMASLAESRFGVYDVHDDRDKMTAQELQLEHNEVAYIRPKKKSSAPTSAPASIPVGPVHTGGTIKLKHLNDEVARAKQKQLILEAQIQKEKREVELLRQRQQQNEKSRTVSQSSERSETPQSRPVSAHSVPLRPVSVHSGSTHSGSAHPISIHSRSNSVSSVRSESTHNESRPASVASRATLSGDSIYEEPVGVSPIAQKIRDNGSEIDFVNDIAIIIPAYEEVKGYAKNPKVKKVVFGGHQEASEEDKTVLLFGPVGSGKTSAINSILNYLYDVKRENDFRLVASTHEGATSGLTVYVFNNTVLPFSVTIVDTPGVPDHKGTKSVSSLIQHWLKTELLSAGAFRLDAISIVLRHDEDSLGWPFIHELAAVRQMFGGDLKTNVLPIITNSEVLPQPIAIRSLAQANIAFVEYYKVNNAGFFADAHGLPKLKHNLFYKHGTASLEHFFRDLQEMIHPLLAVLRNAQLASPKSPAVDGAHLY